MSEKAGSIPLALVLVLVLVAAWILYRVVAPKEVHGTVSTEDPTVTGESVLPGTDVYWGRRVDSIELDDPGNPAIDPAMRDLIWRSNQAIAADEAEDN